MIIIEGAAIQKQPPELKLIKSYQLCGGVTARVENMTSHYFGGYFHVKVRVVADLLLNESFFDDTEKLSDARKLLGDKICFERLLEKMAVPKDEISAVTENLIASFDTNLLPYLLRADFPKRFVAAEYSKQLKLSARKVGR